MASETRLKVAETKRPGEEQSAMLEAAFKQQGFGFVRLVPHGA